MALHRTGQAHAERLRRELQWASEGRVLNETLFTSLPQARLALEDWRRDYNNVRPTRASAGWRQPSTRPHSHRNGTKPLRSKGLRASAHCSNCAGCQPPDSRFYWIKVGGNVNSQSSSRANTSGCSQFYATVANPAGTPPAGDMDIRTFAGLKSPKTLNEKVAVVAFFLAQVASPAERRDFITSEDIKPYFIQAGFELPTALINMSLTNAKNAGYLNALERGQYKLNSVGHNLVAHKLPKKDGASRTLGSLSRSRRQRRRARDERHRR